jgi:hypothetical protein
MSLRHLLFAFCLAAAVTPAADAQERGRTTTADSTHEEDLMGMLDDEEPAARKKDYISATFKATRIINGHSIENVGQGVLDFRISHRFGPVNNGISDFFGLDGATTRLGFDYGITDWLMVGIGRSSLNKEVDGFFKAKLLRQTAKGGMPFSLSVVGASGIQTTEAPAMAAGKEYYFSNRIAYTTQVLLARKFSNAFSLQLMPTLVHYNLVQLESDPNNVIAIGIGGRLKLSQRISLTGEYYYTLEGNKLPGSTNALAVGLDIETGGHVFQLFFTNSTGISERTFIGQTTGDWGNSDIHFGFNISRVFTIVKPKDMEGTRNRIW